MQHHSYKIIKQEILAREWSSLVKLHVEARPPAGPAKVLFREVADHGHGAAILPVDPSRGMCLLVRQWRAGAVFAGHDDWLIEACAGLLDGDAPEACVRREAMEELGVRVHDVAHMCECFSSPGAFSERMSLFTARYAPEDRVAPGGGLAQEHEEIEVMEMPLREAFGLIASGGIVDAKTIILLQHAIINNL